jgi:osmotically-inducible protein OsmY
MKNDNLLKLALGSIAVCTMLTGCPAILLTGGAVGMFAAADRRTTGAQVDDQGIELRAHDRLRNAFTDSKAEGISVASYNGRALMYGQAPDDATRTRAEDTVRGTAGVREVVDEVTVGPGATFGNHASDTLIANKVRASLINAKGVPSGAINVTVEKGTVYLMGLLSDVEADRAANVAAAVDGVVRVVKVFETPTQADLDRINRTVTNQTPSQSNRPD